MEGKSKFSFSLSVLVIFAVIGILSPFIANDKPLFCICEGKFKLPVLNEIWNGRHKFSDLNFNECKSHIYPPIKFGASTIDKSLNKAVGPQIFSITEKNVPRHWLGTDNLGRDVAAGLVHGTGIALTVAFITVFLSLFFGTAFGMLAGYYGDNGIRAGWMLYAGFSLILFITGYYTWMEWIIFNHQPITALMVFLFVIFILAVLLKLLKGKSKANTGTGFPLDMLLMKVVELRKSIPALFLILACLNLFRYGSIWNIILIATFLGWIEFARFARAETLNIVGENYIIGARVLGYSDLRILMKYILPSILPTLVVVACFSAAGVILLESTLSFLGIGLSAEDVSWGKMLAQGRNMKAWWLVVFPGTALFMLILALNVFADRMRKD
jgi:peptide/nickel transport system permease protein